jgi:hypothetical protein
MQRRLLEVVLEYKGGNPRINEVKLVFQSLQSVYIQE